MQSGKSPMPLLMATLHELESVEDVLLDFGEGLSAPVNLNARQKQRVLLAISRCASDEMRRPIEAHCHTAQGDEERITRFECSRGHLRVSQRLGQIDEPRRWDRGDEVSQRQVVAEIDDDLVVVGVDDIAQGVQCLFPIAPRRCLVAMMNRHAWWHSI